MGAKAFLSLEQIKTNVEKLQAHLTEKELSGAYISSYDYYLNEYVPLNDCHRYYFTGFTGSTAEVFVPSEGKVLIYVDPRYHEQADLEVDPTIVEVVKCTKSLTITLKETLKQCSLTKIGVEFARASVDFKDKLAVIAEVVDLEDSVEKMLDKNSERKLGAIKKVEDEFCGDTTALRLGRIFEDAQEDEASAYFVSAIDTISWLTNCRGYHLPFLSSFLSQALVTKEKVYVFIPEGVPVDESASSIVGVSFSECTPKNLAHQLAQLQHRHQSSTIKYDPMMINARDYKILSDVYGSEKLKAEKGMLLCFQSIKDQKEQAEIKRSFALASKAIFNTVNWVKDEVDAGKNPSEKALYNKTTECYQAQGAVTQSFNTISGVDANGSIIHYSDPKETVKIQKASMCLLDSGGYFESGYATDTTRTFLGSREEVASDQFKSMFTLVLKSFIQCHRAIFPEGVTGALLDFLTREPLYQKGMNFGHGTGHGVGVHVHEGGTGISQAMTKPLKAGHVLSIEPGLYEPGTAGVRIENVAVVKKHPEYPGHLYFEPLTMVGMDPRLINFDELNQEEKAWLKAYEINCQALGTSLMTESELEQLS